MIKDSRGMICYGRSSSSFRAKTKPTLNWRCCDATMCTKEWRIVWGTFQRQSVEKFHVADFQLEARKPCLHRLDNYSKFQAAFCLHVIVCCRSIIGPIIRRDKSIDQWKRRMYWRNRQRFWQQWYRFLLGAKLVKRDLREVWTGKTRTVDLLCM